MPDTVVAHQKITWQDHRGKHILLSTAFALFTLPSDLDERGVFTTQRFEGLHHRLVVACFGGMCIVTVATGLREATRYLLIQPGL